MWLRPSSCQPLMETETACEMLDMYAISKYECCFFFMFVFTTYHAPADQMACKGVCSNVITNRNCFYLTVWFL